MMYRSSRHEAYRNGWTTFVQEKQTGMFSTGNPYNHETQKFSYACWNQGYNDSTGEYVVWDFE